MNTSITGNPYSDPVISETTAVGIVSNNYGVSTTRYDVLDRLAWTTRPHGDHVT